MSLELHGRQIGEAVGTKDYFRRLNNSTILSDVSNDSEPIDYFGKLSNVCSRIHSIFDEVYSDLCKNIKIIRYIPADDLKNTIKIIMGLYDIGHIINTNTGNSDNIVSILSLSDSRTQPSSRAGNREIQNAINIIRNGGSVYMSSNERLHLVEKAVDYGVKSAAGNDDNKIKYLQEVLQGSDREFLSDVLFAVEYRNNPNKFTGRGGRVICSREYIDYIERYVFEKDLPNVYSKNNGDRQYKRLLTDGLDKIIDVIDDDLTSGLNKGMFITNENAERLKKALNNLDKCRISNASSLTGKVNRLNKLVAKDGEVAEHAVSISGGEMYVEYRKGGFVSLYLKKGDTLNLLLRGSKSAYEMAAMIKKDYKNYFNDGINLSDDAMAIEIVFHAYADVIAEIYRYSGESIPALERALNDISISADPVDMGRENKIRYQQIFWDALDKIRFWK